MQEQAICVAVQKGMADLWREWVPDLAIELEPVYRGYHLAVTDRPGHDILVLECRDDWTHIAEGLAAARVSVLRYLIARKQGPTPSAGATDTDGEGLQV